MSFTEKAAGKVGRVTSGGIVSEFALSGAAAAQPQDIALGPDSRLWIAETNRHKIGAIQP